jgi:hypothetical protein
MKTRWFPLWLVCLAIVFTSVPATDTDSQTAKPKQTLITAEGVRVEAIVGLRPAAVTAFKSVDKPTPDFPPGEEEVFAATTDDTLVRPKTGVPLLAPRSRSKPRSDDGTIPFAVQDAIDRLRNYVHEKDGVLAADTGSFVARFEGETLDFVLKDSDPLVRADLPFHYEFFGIFVDGDAAPISLGPADEVRHQANWVEIVRSDLLTERYEVLDAGVEQIFVLHRAPQGLSGELEIRGVFDTPLTVENPEPERGEPLLFLDGSEPALRVGQVRVSDAAGRELLGRLRVAGSYLSILLDGDWLAGAAYPVRVDPLIGSPFQIGNATPAHIPDVSYNYLEDQYLVVWEREWTPTDFDIWGSLVSWSGAVINSGFSIESPTTNQTDPAVSYAAGTNRWLVCWRDDRRGYFDIFCEVLEPTGSGVTSPYGSFLINSETDDQLHPDVACYSSSCMAVFADEYLGSGTDLDIKGARVDTSSGTVLTNFTVVGAATQEVWPAIAFNSDALEYMVVWEENTGDWDLRAQVVSYTGALVGSNCVIAAVTANDFLPDIAYNPFSGLFLVAWFRGALGSPSVAYAQVETPNCTTWTDDFVVHSDGDDSVDPRVAAGGPDGCFAVSVLDEYVDTTPYEVEVRRVCPDGSIPDAATIGASFVPNRFEMGIGYNLDDDEFLIAWANSPAAPVIWGHLYGAPPPTCPDVDNDGWAVCTGGCALAPGDQCGDCNDNNPFINPGADELCNGVNDDCNTGTPDGWDEPWLGVLCDGPDPDLCNEGNYVCISGSQQCTDITGPNLELCDGVNNDCNTGTPDGWDEPWRGDPCDGPDPDLCTEGSYVCTSGSQRCTDNTGPNLELCDGVNNDCNTGTPDGWDEPWRGDPCDGPDPDLCNEGSYICSAGSQQCTDITGPNLELCDGVNNDCNPGTPDGADEPWLGIPCDGPDPDLCTEGSYVCTSGSQQCTDFTGPSVEICDNGLDDDCDGWIDGLDPDCAADCLKGDPTCDSVPCALFDVLEAIDQALNVDPHYCEADVDCDDSVNVFDILCLIDCALSRPSCLDSPCSGGRLDSGCGTSLLTSRVQVSPLDVRNARVVLGATAKDGPDRASIRLTVDNPETPVSGLAATLGVSKDWRVVSVRPLGAAAALDVDHQQTGDRLRLLLVSTVGEVIPAGGDPVLEIELRREGSFGSPRVPAGLTLLDVEVADERHEQVQVLLEGAAAPGGPQTGKPGPMNKNW